MMSVNANNRCCIPACLAMTGTAVLATYSAVKTIEYQNKFVECYDKVAEAVLKNLPSDLINLEESKRNIAIHKIASNTCFKHQSHYEASATISLGFVLIIAVTTVAAGIIFGRSIRSRKETLKNV